MFTRYATRSNQPYYTILQNKTAIRFLEQIISTDSACEWECSSSTEGRYTKHMSLPKSLWVLKHNYNLVTKAKYI
jgi:hypothetical protein